MIYLDTHVVVWLYAGLTEKISSQAADLINQHDVFISPVVRLECQYLFEIGKITVGSAEITTDLSRRLGLQVCPKPFDDIIQRALPHSWTRDPFDRLIVANAGLNDDILLSKDQKILAHYPQAKW